MKKRISLISIFDTESIHKISNLFSKINETTCKVPYLNKVENRKELDILPYHFTFVAWDAERTKQIKRLLSEMKFDEINISVSDIKVMDGMNNSCVLYLAVSADEELRNIQRTICQKYPSENYNPNEFVFHITLHIDTDKKRMEKIKKQIEENFQPFEVKVSELALFEIYPAKRIV